MASCAQEVQVILCAPDGIQPYCGHASILQAHLIQHPRVKCCGLEAVCSPRVGFFSFFFFIKNMSLFAEIRKLRSWVCCSPSPPVSSSCSEHSRWRVGGGCLLTFPSGMGPNFLNFGKATRGKRDALILVIWKIGIRKNKVFWGYIF